MPFTDRTGLEVDKYPPEYKQYLAEEQELIKDAVRGKSVVDVGCGDGRIIPFVALLCKRYDGVDISEEYLKTAKKIALAFHNVSLHHIDGAKLSLAFGKDSFDVALCVWNTLGCAENPLALLQQMKIVTKEKAFISVLAKGTLEERIKYYKALKMKYTVNAVNEEIISDVWGVTRAYTLEEISELCKKAGFKVLSSKKLAGLVWWLELGK